MTYPQNSEYVKAITYAADNLDQLKHLKPVLDNRGEPYRSGGAFAVVFKMEDPETKKTYALKCFTDEQEGRAEAYRMIAEELAQTESSYFTPVQYLEKELYVDSSTCDENEFPVLLMDWVEGVTLDNYVTENVLNRDAMTMLCYRFCKMAAWLRAQPLAHGDLKPDNIMVRPDGNLVLVDYDGMFVPAMKGRKSPTLGTADFRHPLRSADDFDETIDDFALALIALALKALSLKPELWNAHGTADRLLLGEGDFRNLAESIVWRDLQPLSSDAEMQSLMAQFLISLSQKQLSSVSFRLFRTEMPKIQKSQPAGIETFTVNGVSFNMVYVQGGTFRMGATPEQGEDANSDERPAHYVTLNDYYIGETVVTQALWNAVMRDNPSKFKGNDCPVECVSSYGAQAFAVKLSKLTERGFRLPTEAEWEYAARGGCKRKGFKYAGSNNLDDVAWYGLNNNTRVQPVKQKKPNELGLYDMSGNVLEWCGDWYGEYNGAAQINPKGPASELFRVLRGGSWYDDARNCRVSYRYNHYPDHGNDIYGFRLVLVP